MQQDVAGNLEDGVAGKEQTRADPEHGGGQAQILVHLQGGNAHARPVDPTEEVENSKKHREPVAQLAQRGGFD